MHAWLNQSIYLYLKALPTCYVAGECMHVCCWYSVSPTGRSIVTVGYQEFILNVCSVRGAIKQKCHKLACPNKDVIIESIYKGSKTAIASSEPYFTDLRHCKLSK